MHHAFGSERGRGMRLVMVSKRKKPWRAEIGTTMTMRDWEQEDQADCQDKDRYDDVMQMMMSRNEE
jgi:hypothetical protein